MDNMDGVWVRRMRDAPVCLLAVLCFLAHLIVYYTLPRRHHTPGAKLAATTPRPPPPASRTSREAGLDARHDAMHGPG